MEQEIGNGWAENVHPADRDRCLQNYAEAFDARASFSMEYRLKRHDGAYRWILDVGVPRYAAEHEFSGYIGSCTDITEVKQAEAALRESEARYRSLFNSMDEGFCVIELILDESQKPVDWRYLEVNPSFETLTGIHGIVGKRIRELVPDHEEYWFEIYGKVSLTGEPIRFVNEAKGMGRWFDLYAFRVGGPGSLKVAVLFTNITERKRTEEELLKSQQLLKMAIEGGRFGIWTWDLVTDHLVWNERCKEMVGLPADTEMNLAVALAPIHPEDRDRVNDLVTHALQVRETVHFDYRVIRPDGVVRWMHSRGCTYEDATGKPVTFAGTMLDVTERRQAEESLRRFNAELELQVQERTKVINAAVKDLRAEMTQRLRLEREILEVSEREQCRLGQDLHDDLGQQLAGMGMFAAGLHASLLATSHPSTTEAEYLQTAIQEAVNTTRNLAKSLFPVELERSGLKQALEDLAHGTELLSKIPCQVTVDDDFWIKPESSVQIYRIVQGALSNALKHAQAQHITIECHVRAGVRTVRVCDDGIGFKMAELGGESAGIGLHLFKYRARMLGATVEVQAGSDGRGCQVILRFPPPPKEFLNS